MVPFQAERKAKVLERLKGCVPQCKVTKASFSNTFLDNLNQLSVCACTWEMCHYGIERNGIGNIRIQTHGRRQVILANWCAICRIAEKHSISRDRDCEVPDWCQKVLTEFVPEDVNDNTVKKNCWHHTMLPEETMVIPMGYGTIERTLPVSTEPELTPQQQKRKCCSWTAGALPGGRRETGLRDVA